MWSEFDALQMRLLVLFRRAEKDLELNRSDSVHLGLPSAKEVRQVSAGSFPVCLCLGRHAEKVRKTHSFKHPDLPARHQDQLRAPINGASMTFCSPTCSCFLTPLLCAYLDLVHASHTLRKPCRNRRSKIGKCPQKLSNCSRKIRRYR